MTHPTLAGLFEEWQSAQIAASALARALARHPEVDTAAEDCCGGPAGIGYLCPVCELPHDTEEYAIACCDWERTPEGARQIRAALEEAGQLGLEL